MKTYNELEKEVLNAEVALDLELDDVRIDNDTEKIPKLRAKIEELRNKKYEEVIQ
jgi:hypothetical protein